MVSDRGAVPAGFDLLARSRVLFETGSIPEAEQTARAACELMPDDLDARRHLAEVLLRLHKSSDAIRVLEGVVAAEPSADNLRRLGFALLVDLVRWNEALGVFERAIAAGQNDWQVYYEVGMHLLRRRVLDQAASWLQKAADHASRGTLGGTLFELGNALRLQGRVTEAEAVYERAANHWLEEYRKNVGALPPLMWLVRILFAMGDREQALGVYRDAIGHRGPESFTYGPAYLPNTPARVAKLKRLIGGRDVAILLHGPSIRDLHERIREFAPLDLVYIGLSRFRNLEEEILEPVGRRFSVVSGTNPTVLSACGPAYREFLARPEENLLVTSAYAMPGFDVTDEQRSQVDERLLYVSSSGPVLPTPDDPLQIMPGNTLALLLPTLLLGEPRRVVLFGADGGVPAGASESHYLSQNSSFAWKQSDVERVNCAHNVYLDALEFDEIFPVQSACTTALFGVRQAPVWNCSLRTAYNAFPRISYDDCLQLLRSTP